ncbi:MAG: hypothetical protein QFB86_04585 [Patescibacteria group bacterium]|nr:hypothetical protein [Patescibacteria group bacterium]
MTITEVSPEMLTDIHMGETLSTIHASNGIGVYEYDLTKGTVDEESLLVGSGILTYVVARENQELLKIAVQEDAPGEGKAIALSEKGTAISGQFWSRITDSIMRASDVRVTNFNVAA